MEAKTIFDFSAVDLNGNEVSLSKYKGTPCLIVNFSTKDAACEKVFNILASLHKKYHNETRQGLWTAACWELSIMIAFFYWCLYSSTDLNILLFPCFQFGASESANEIFAFFESNSNRQVGDVFAEIEVSTLPACG